MRSCLCALFLLTILTPAGRASAAALPVAPPRMADIGDLPLERGGMIRACRLEYRTFGTLNADRSNAVLFPTWFSGRTADLIDNVGRDALVDDGRLFVILVGALGDGLSSSPSNSPAQKNAAFPEYTVRDMVEAERRLVTDVLHVPHLAAVVGISMGGMQAFQWGVSHPDLVSRVVSIVGTPRLSPYDRLLWRTELETLTRELQTPCDNGARPAVMRVVGLIHELALSTPDHVNQTVTPGAFDAWVSEREQTYQTEQDPFDWASQLRAMLDHDVTAPFGGSIEAAARATTVPLLAVVSRRDHMVNPESTRAFVAAAPRAQLLELTGDCGHLANGCEADRLRAAFRAFLDGTP